MTPDDTKKDDGFFADLFDGYKQAIILLLMIIAYNIIPAGLAFLGFWLAHGLDYNAFIAQVMAIVANPGTLIGGVHWGYFIILGAAVIALVNFGAAFLFTASRNDKIAKPLGFIKAIIAAWGILFQYAIIILIFVGIYFGLTYLGVAIVNLILIIVAAVVGGISLLGMIFRVIGYLLELE